MLIAVESEIMPIQTKKTSFMYLLNKKVLNK